MKRFWSTYEFTLQQERRKRKFNRQERRKRKFNRRRSYTRRPEHASKGFRRSVQRDQIRLQAPETLNLFDGAGGTLKYCNKLRYHLTQPDTIIFLDFGNVLDFTIDALILIRAIMKSGVYSTHIAGNLPRDPTVASEFKASGFFSGIARPPDNLPDPRGLIMEESNTTVHAKIAANLVDFAREHVPLISEQTSRTCSQTLVEVMTNTHNHARASEQDHPKTWFVSVYCRNGKAYFSFVDLGVGILNSIPARTMLRKVHASIRPHGKPYGRIALLEDAFKGKIGSATDKPGRGLGLPRMRRDAKNGLLLGLEVLTSDVVGSVSDLDFKRIGDSLSGTIFRWCAS